MELALFLILSIISVPQEIKFPLSYLKFIGETIQMEEASLSSLDSLAEFLELTGAKIEIGGHTDNVGVPSEKQKLSEARARAVCDYLKSKHKIPESNLTYKGYGPSMPIATNRTPEGRARNNRVEIKVLSPIPVARLEFIKGKILVHKEGISEPEEINDFRYLTLFDRILTDSLGRADIQFDGITINVLPNSDIALKKLSMPEKGLGIYMKAGKIKVTVSNTNLSVTTPTCTVTTNQGEFLFESEMYYQDLLSVWSGSAKISASGVSEVVNENYGTICYYGKKPASPRLLPQAPILDTIHQKDYFEYDEKNPFKFFFNKPGEKVHFILGKDPEFGDVIYETVTESESCVVKSIDLPHIYLYLGSVDESGLESRSLKVYCFEVINPKKRYTGPTLQITKQVIENTESGRIILLEGKTEPDCELLINNFKVKVQTNGRFSFRAKILPNTQSVNLVSIDKKGRRTSLRIPISKRGGMGIEISGGLSMLAGGGLDASKIGLILAGNIGYLSDKIGIGIFVNTGTIGCKTTDWEPEGEHFKTQIYIGGLRLKYIFNPYANLSFYTGTEIGAGYWKSFYDNAVYEWAINPYGGGILGVKKDISQKFSLLFEGGAGYLLNKTKPNMGTRDVNYIIPKGYLGIFYKIF